MKLTPLKFTPIYKDYLWGGDRLRKEFNKFNAPHITAESWELSDHHDGRSFVSEGQLVGRTISELREIDKNSYWGTDCLTDVFPIMVKLIDAAKDLSIQVHPSEETAIAENGEQGKAEMWYVVDCKPRSYIYLGFSQKISQNEFVEMAKNGSICNVLNRIQVKRGDVFYIEPGTIHAIGAGILIAEIQQTSNSTFRIYDYDRHDSCGNSRDLHVRRAAQVINYELLLPEECKANCVMTFPEFTMAEMFTCKYFRAYKMDVYGTVRLKCDGRSFQHLLCVEGNGRIVVSCVEYLFRKGESYFLPASLGEYHICGTCRVLLSSL